MVREMFGGDISGGSWRIRGEAASPRIDRKGHSRQRKSQVQRTKGRSDKTKGAGDEEQQNATC